MFLADILFLAIVAYLLYRFVFNFLLPIMRATQQVRQQFRNMQGGANGFDGTPPGGQAGQRDRMRSGGQTGSTDTGDAKRPQKPPADDYIDFEEIK